MAKGLKELRIRVRSVRNTKKITRAMEMVSAAKLRRSHQAMANGLPFLQKLQLLLGRLALSPKALENPLFRSAPSADLPAVVLLFTADRGLCGAFNSNLIKMADRFLRENPDALLYCMGKKGYDYFRKRIGSRLVGHRIDLGGQLDGELTDGVAQELQQMFLEGIVSSVQIIAPEYVSTAYNRPRRTQYIPLEPTAFGLTAEEADKPVDYVLEPSPERVFEALLPRYLSSQIFLQLAETQTCEHSSRMVAMNSATKNCDDLTEKLTLEMNKARQAAITKEILEIVGGAEALKG